MPITSYICSYNSFELVLSCQIYLLNNYKCLILNIKLFFFSENMFYPFPLKSSVSNSLNFMPVFKDIYYLASLTLYLFTTHVHFFCKQNFHFIELWHNHLSAVVSTQLGSHSWSLAIFQHVFSIFMLFSYLLHCYSS